MTREKLHATYQIYSYQRILDHEALPINWDYLKQELRWYVNADYHDGSIAERASQWDKVRNPDGWWNSNYGYWLWGPPQRLRWVIDELNRDPASRRAVCHINTPETLGPDQKDVPCTMYMNFHVRYGRLYPIVHMRSQDAVWGLRNDLPFFWLVADIVSAATGWKLGYMNYSVDSLHIYERHWEKVHKVAQNPGDWLDSKLDVSALVDKVLNDKLKIVRQEPRFYNFGQRDKPVVHLPPAQGGLFTD